MATSLRDAIANGEDTWSAYETPLATIATAIQSSNAVANAALHIDPAPRHGAPSTPPTSRQQVTGAMDGANLNFAVTDTPDQIDATPAATPVDPQHSTQHPRQSRQLLASVHPNPAPHASVHPHHSHWYGKAARLTTTTTPQTSMQALTGAVLAMTTPSQRARDVDATPAPVPTTHAAPSIPFQGPDHRHRSHHYSLPD